MSSNMTYAAANGLTLNLNYSPVVTVPDITVLTNEDWLEQRKKGIGGSDYSIIYGISPFNTARDLYYNKLGKNPIFDPDDNWVAKEIGHALEEIVAKLFYQKTGIQPYAVKKMFRHPEYYWMQANVDYFVDIPDENGVMRTYILEIKTTSYNNKDKWGTEFAQTVPYGYELQGRSYCAVCNVSGVIFACLYDNNEASLIVRKVSRDLDIEAEIIEEGRKFWQDHVEMEIEPEYTEVGDLLLKSVRKWQQPTVPNKKVSLIGTEEVDSGETLDDLIADYLKVEEEKQILSKRVDGLSEELKTKRALIEHLSGGQYEGSISLSDGSTCKIKYTNRTVRSISAKRMNELKIANPALFKSLEELIDGGYINVSTSDFMSLKRYVA